MTTVPDEEEGQKLARQLVMARLAACVTISAASNSYYWWQGKISEEKEYILFIKTQDSLFPELEKKLLQIHPYDVPEIIVPAKLARIALALRDLVFDLDQLGF